MRFPGILPSSCLNKRAQLRGLMAARASKFFDREFAPWVVRKPAKQITQRPTLAGSRVRLNCDCPPGRHRNTTIICAIRRARAVKILFHQREAAARNSQSFLPCVQLLKLLLELFKLLSSFAELAFRCQPLIVSEVSGGSGNERVQIRTGVGSGCAGASSRFNADSCGAQRRGLSAK